MSNNELKMYFYKCLNSIFDDESLEFDYNILQEIKYFILNNSDAQDVIEMKNVLCSCIYQLYDKNNLRDALNISDYYKYGKRLKLYGIAHSDIYDNFESFFINVVPIPYGIRMDDYYNCFLSENGFNTLPSLDKLKDNGILEVHLTRSLYNNLDQEIMYLKWALNGELCDDYYGFIHNKKINDACYHIQYDGDSYNDYINKKIGNIGELYWYDFLRKIDSRTILASRDYGDGLGYDIYGIQNDNGTEKELLVEVKSTMNPYKNGFQLSDNEYAVMMDVLSNPNANYLVATAFIDHNNNFQITRGVFMATGEDEFYSINNGEKYLLDQDSSCKIFKKKLI